MPSRYELWLTDDRGTRLAYLDDVIEFEYVRVANDVGAFGITIGETFDRSLLRVDRRVEFWRAPTEEDALTLDFIGFIRYWRIFTDDRGSILTRIIGVDLNDLLARRIIAYPAGSAQAEKYGAADDILKAIVRENFHLSATDPDRDMSPFGFQVQADVSKGPILSKAFAWRNVLKALQDVVEASKQLGVELYFDIVPLTRKVFEFQTFIGQEGVDRTWPGGVNPIIFGLEFGNATDLVKEEDYTNEVNYVYAGGQGQGSERVIEERSDTERVSASVWNRREAFADARNCQLVQTVGNPTFSGTGLNDMSTSGEFTGVNPLTYVVEIDGIGTPDTFKWSDDGGNTWDATGVNITGDAQLLNNGVYITFQNTTGHTVGDRWTFQTQTLNSYYDCIRHAGDAQLRAGRPRRRFRATLLDTPAAQYGKHWRFGDKVTVRYLGESFDTVIRYLRVSVDKSGRETIQAQVEIT